SVPILLQKSFPLVTKNSPGCRRDFRVKMWGTSSPDDKLAGDLARATEATKIAGRRSDRLLAGKLSPRHFGLLQQNLPLADQVHCSKQRAYWMAFPTSTIRGTRIVKVEPRPGSLSTVISPPII